MRHGWLCARSSPARVFSRGLTDDAVAAAAVAAAAAAATAARARRKEIRATTLTGVQLSVFHSVPRSPILHRCVAVAVVLVSRARPSSSLTD